MSAKLHLRRYFCGQARRATIALSSHLARIGFSPYRSIVPSIAIWSKAAYINMVPARDLGSARTKPISRRVVTTGTGREHVVDRRRNVRRLGEIAQSKLVVTESVEAYPGPSGAYPAVLPGAGGGSQLLKETVALPVLRSPSPDQGSVVRRELW